MDEKQYREILRHLVLANLLKIIELERSGFFDKDKQKTKPTSTGSEFLSFIRNVTNEYREKDKFFEYMGKLF